MAQLVIRRFDVPGSLRFKEGDIVNAIPTRKAEEMHGYDITWGRGSQRWDAQGFTVDPLGLRRLWMDKTAEYRFERRSATQVIRVTLADLSELDVSAEMAIAQHVAKRRAANAAQGGAGSPLFGTDGAEEWYGGVTTLTQATLGELWTAIEAETGLLRADHGQDNTQLGTPKNLVLNVDDFDAATKRLLRSPRETVQETVVTIDEATPSAVGVDNRWNVGVAGNFSQLVPEAVYDIRDDPLGVGVHPSAVEDVNGNVYTLLAPRGPADRNALVKGRGAPTLGAATVRTTTDLAKRRHWCDWRNGGWLTAQEVSDCAAGLAMNVTRQFLRANIVIDKDNP